MLPISAEPAVLPQISQVAAVALAETVLQVVAQVPAVHIKWPNDLLVGGAKAAGILVEGTRTLAGTQICVIGCGVNCATFPDNLPYKATSLAQAAGRPVDADVLFLRLRSSMAEALSTWDDGRGYPAIRTRWLARALPLDTPLVVRTGREPISGRFQGIDMRGRLLLLGPHGPVTVEAGEVILT